MRARTSETVFEPQVTLDDWQLIFSALAAYSHNVQYRDLLERLEQQGVQQPDSPGVVLTQDAPPAASHGDLA